METSILEFEILLYDCLIHVVGKISLAELNLKFGHKPEQTVQIQIRLLSDQTTLKSSLIKIYTVCHSVTTSNTKCVETFQVEVPGLIFEIHRWVQTLNIQKCLKISV